MKNRKARFIKLNYLGWFQPLIFKWRFRWLIPYSKRKLHTFILGGSGSGKTELIKQFLFNDIQSKSGVFALDPHGEFVEQVAKMKLFRRKRYRDKLVYISFDAGDGIIPTFNPLENSYQKIKSQEKKLIAISGHAEHLTASFENIVNEKFSHNMETLVFYCLKLLLCIPGTTLVEDFTKLLEENNESVVNKYLKDAGNLVDKDMRNFFTSDFLNERQFGNTKNAIRTRFRRAFTNQYLQKMFGSKTSSFNVSQLLNQGKIVLINCSKEHLVNAENVRFIGAFFTAELNRMAFNRARISPELRRPVFVYMDEFQNFANSHTAEMLSETRKYGIHLTMAHQNLDQVSTDLQATILGNTSVKLCGSVNAKDESTMSKNLKLAIGDIKRLEKGKFVLGVQGRNPIVVQSFDFLARPRPEKNWHYMSERSWNEVLKLQQSNYYSYLAKPIEQPRATFIPQIQKFSKSALCQTT